jgi:hypothetical protein
MWEARMKQRDCIGDLLFPIRSAPLRDFYAGYLPDGRQALVVCSQCGKMVMVVFDREGNLTGVVHQELPTPRQFLEAGDLPAAYEDNYEEYLRSALGVSPGLIRIKSFCLPEEELAVYQLPEGWYDFLQNPTDPTLSEEERKQFPVWIQEWKARGQFVFLWYNDLWLDSTGEVVAS